MDDFRRDIIAGQQGRSYTELSLHTLKAIFMVCILSVFLTSRETYRLMLEMLICMS